MKKILSLCLGFMCLWTLSPESNAGLWVPEEPTCPPSFSDTPIAVTACGATIDASGTYVLQNDILKCCPATGAAAITIRADCVTLDLNGHTISGKTPIGTNYAGKGIAIYGSKDLMITNGTIKNFISAIEVNPDPARGKNVENLTVSYMGLDKNSRGIFTNRTGTLNTFKFEYNSISNHVNQAMYLFYATNGEIRDNDIVRNGKENIGLNYCENITVEGNRLLNNVSGVYVTSSKSVEIFDNAFCGNYYGVMMTAGGENNKIHQNNFFKGTSLQAQDNGALSIWDGNYWNDHTTCPTPYLVNGTAGSIDNHPVCSPVGYAPACN
jgi:nitrous oxidase accessory protein NosD